MVAGHCIYPRNHDQNSVKTRRTKPASRYRFGDIEVDFQQQRVTVQGKPLTLTAKEFGLLRLLVQCRPRILTRQQIRKEVWGDDLGESSRTKQRPQDSTVKFIKRDKDGNSKLSLTEFQGKKEKKAYRESSAGDSGLGRSRARLSLPGGPKRNPWLRTNAGEQFAVPHQDSPSCFGVRPRVPVIALAGAP